MTYLIYLCRDCPLAVSVVKAGHTEEVGGVQVLWCGE